MPEPRTERLARLAAACAALLFAHAAAAADWGLAQLMQELGQVKRAEARFTERKYLRVLNAPRVSSGTLTYIAPDKLEKRTLKPKPEALLVDGDVLTVEHAQGKKRTLRLGDYPVLRAFVESIRATLGGDAATLERYYKVQLEGGRERWELFLAPRERAMSQVISQIRIAGGGGRVGLIEVQEAKGDRTVTTVSGEAQ
jgi:hypothetical protein